MAMRTCTRCNAPTHALCYVEGKAPLCPSCWAAKHGLFSANPLKANLISSNPQGSSKRVRELVGAA
jgi:hypothetical protein